MVLPQVLLASSLQKILPDRTPTADLDGLSGWAGQRCSFQVAWLPPSVPGHSPETALKVVVEGAPATCFAVDLVPAQVPCWPGSTDGYLVEHPTMLPDILRPLASGEAAQPRHVGWHSVWVDVVADSDLLVQVFDGEHLVLEQVVPVTVVPSQLPAAEITVTQWFHADALACYYGVEMWSEEHWKAVESQVRAAARMGVSMLLTPLWTPPVDTAIGSDRPRAQLLDISLGPEGYTFKHERLDRWLDLLAAAGITKVEVPHLFTQWGARCAPQIWVEVEGVETKLFGWHTPATDPGYLGFMSAVIPFVRNYFAERLGADNVVFHVSDEPSDEQLATYLQALNQVSGWLAGATVIDALSHAEFAEHVSIPAVATDAVAEFRAIGIEPAWVYHCVAQNGPVANRFLAQAGVRTRALGWQLYKAGATGFLHWGFNFYFARLAERPLDPYADTSAGGGFISGDPFIVYPGEDFTTVESIRHRLFADAMGDLAAAQQAERILGRAAVLEVIDPSGDLDYDSGWVSGEQWLERRKLLDGQVAASVRAQSQAVAGVA